MPTELQDFRNKYLETGSAVIDRLAGTRTEMAGAIEVLREGGHEIVPLIATHGGSGGIVTRDCHAYLRDRLLDTLDAAGPVDGVFLALHGAMCAEGVDDVEGDLLARVAGLSASADRNELRPPCPHHAGDDRELHDPRRLQALPA